MIVMPRDTRVSTDQVSKAWGGSQMGGQPWAAPRWHSMASSSPETSVAPAHDRVGSQTAQFLRHSQPAANETLGDTGASGDIFHKVALLNRLNGPVSSPFRFCGSSIGSIHTSLDAPAVTKSHWPHICQ